MDPSFRWDDVLVFWLALFFILLSFPLSAEEWISTHAIAMHGAPKYAADFKAFDYVNADAPKTGTLRLNIVGTFDSLNPFIVKGRAVEGTGYVFEPLMARSQDEPFTLYPLIAEKIDVKADRSAIRFHLNPKARWQDGEPVTAGDVLFSWEVLRTKGRPNHRGYYNKVAHAEMNDAHTVTFTFKPGEDGAVDREMPLIMGLMTVLPAHFFKDKNFDETTLAPMIGSGPYKMTRVEPGRSITFTRDENYWGRDLPARRGLGNFDTIRYDYYRDEDIAKESFTAHQVDARRETDPRRWAELQKIATEKPDGFKTYAFTHQRPEPVRAFIFNMRHSFFTDIRVREALNNAFDFEWMNRTLFRGEYKRTESYFPNSELAVTGLPSEKERGLLAPWRKELPAALFKKAFALPRANGTGPGAMRDNLLHATELLQRAGYEVKNGILHDKSGKPLSFEILLSDPQDEKIALEYTRMLQRLGIAVRVRTVDAAQFQSRLNDFDYDMILFRWVNSLSPGNEQAIYWGSKAADIKGSRNYAGIKSAAVDDLVLKITAAHTREDLVAAAHALDRVLLWNYLSVPLAYRGADLFAIWPDIGLPSNLPLYGMVVESWWTVKR
ncbi:MAG: ABC transporter substrate-binding protein [Proteobacteria bacterium]|nr:ABC transporter substrate-binding protein [Pseudomonadota bacterium]